MTDIAGRIEGLNTSQNRQAEELKSSIEANIDLARKNITATFAAGNTASAAASQGGGEEQ